MVQAMPESFNLLNDDVKMECIRYITGIESGGEVVVLVKKTKDTRSSAQLRLKWLWMGQLAKEMAGRGSGKNNKDWNRHFKGLFLKELLISQDEDYAEFYANGKLLIDSAPTAALKKFAIKAMLDSVETEWLTVKNMSEYMNNIDNFCIENLEIVLAVPSDLNWIRN